MFLRGSYGVSIIGCVACLITFMYLFFSSRKTVFKSLLDTFSTPSFCRASKLVFLITISTPPRHLVDRSRSSCLLDSFSTARSIDWASMLDMVGCSSTLPRHLHLSTAIFSTPSSTACSIPLDTYICRDLLMAYLISSCDPQLIFVDLSLDTSVFSTPKSLSLTPIFFLRFLQDFLRFSLLSKLLISHIHAFHVLKPRIWGFWKILGFFKIVEFFLKFWDGF